MSQDNVTIKERMILHLDRFPGMDPNEIFNVPFDLTQDGIASVVGVSRAHASLELKKLKEVGKIDDWLAHIKGSGSKRKVYYLLSEGKREAEMLKKRFESSGITIDALLDMKRCDPAIMWENLNEKDKEAFGLACTFRLPVPRKSILDTESGVIPTDFNGMIQIGDTVKEKYLSVIDSEKIKIWHSQASDWWMGNDDDQERLYHLVCAGRHIDSCKLLIKNSNNFLENPNEDLLDSMKKINPSPKYAESIYSMRAILALKCKDTDDANFCADVLDDYMTSEPTLIRAEANILLGNLDKAFEDSSKLFIKDESARAALIAANALYRMKKYEETNKFLHSTYKTLTENGDASHIDDILFLRAGIAYEQGKPDDSLNYLNKALNACKSDMAKERIKTLIKTIKSGDGPVCF